MFFFLFQFAFFAGDLVYETIKDGKDSSDGTDSVYLLIALEGFLEVQA